MRIIIRTGLRPITILAALATMALASCASVDTVATPVDLGPTQPRVSSYACADGGSITVENLGSAVRVVDEAGEGVDLPAAPPAQRSRYGEGADAIVLDGGDALFMRAGQTPLTCKR